MTDQDWDQADEVTHVSKPGDTIPCPPPTEPMNDRPFLECSACGARMIWDVGALANVCERPGCEAGRA